MAVVDFCLSFGGLVPVSGPSTEVGSMKENRFIAKFHVVCLTHKQALLYAVKKETRD